MEKGQNIGQSTEVRKVPAGDRREHTEDFVLEKNIFVNIFEKDIRRVFIYKKAERLAKAIHLIVPAFSESVSLKNRIDAIAIGLIDAAMLSPSTGRGALSRELLALSSVLSIARTSGTLSSMNADLIAREAHLLLHEVAAYEEPRLSFDETPTLSTIAKSALLRSAPAGNVRQAQKRAPTNHGNKGHLKDISDNSVKDRSNAVLSVIKNKGTASIKDISTLVRGVSEKTIQRELAALIGAGVVLKHGERRWSTYSLVLDK
ncbi:MAG: Uncharacterized protein G01um101491_376 [Parcubacteria group bacterium Gr01-1014_91]|nr:MAG: Uncharacterized protein G01um101491_376 [Parcubacteria group bacterium Gr01-1014_91]